MGGDRLVCASLYWVWRASLDLHMKGSALPEMRKPLLAASAIILLACTGCTISLPSPVQSPPASGQDVETASPQETTGPNLCETSTAESIELLNAAMDRMDRATSPSEVEEASAPMNELFNQAGASMGENCGREGAGDAVSELIVWASSAASSRPPLSASFAEGFLGSVCNLDTELGIEFTPTAQIACAG